MFNPFRPRCTVDPVTRAWIDDRLAWLAGQFPGTRGTVWPTSAFFPDPYDGTDAAVRVLLGRVCGYMGVNPERLDLCFFTNPARQLNIVNADGDAVPTTAAGTYHRGETHFVIRLERAQADRPMSWRTSG